MSDLWDLLIFWSHPDIYRQYIHGLYHSLACVDPDVREFAAVSPGLPALEPRRHRELIYTRLRDAVRLEVELVRRGKPLTLAFAIVP